MNSLVAVQDGSSVAIFDGFREDAVAVKVVRNDKAVVATGNGGGITKRPV